MGGKWLDKRKYFVPYNKLNFLNIVVNNKFSIGRIITFIGEERVKIQQHITWVNIIIFTGVKVNTNFLSIS